MDTSDSHLTGLAAANTPESRTYHGIKLEFDAWGKLRLTDATGQTYEGVEPVRGFPLTSPEACVSICDSLGHELVFIPHLKELPHELCKTIETRLAQREFMPIVRRIRKASTKDEALHWMLTTDRGDVRVPIRNEDDFRRLGPDRVLIIDASGIRYLIPSSRSLDATSRTILRKYI